MGGKWPFWGGEIAGSTQTAWSTVASGSAFRERIPIRLPTGTGLASPPAAHPRRRMGRFRPFAGPNVGEKWSFRAGKAASR